MRVLLIANLPPRSSPEADHALHLCRHLADRGLDVHVVTTAESTTAAHPRVKVHPVMRRWSWAELPRLAYVLRRVAPSAVLLVFVYWGFRGISMITYLPAVVKALLPRTRFVTLFEDAEGVSPWTQTALWEPGLVPRAIRKAVLIWAGTAGTDPLYGALLRDSDRLIAVSPQVGAVLADRSSWAKGKLEIIPVPPVLFLCPDDGGRTRERRREALGVRPGEFLLTYFGYVYPTKGIETLLAAFHRVSRRRGDTRLLVSGGDLVLPERPAYREELRALCQRLGLEARVLWRDGFRWDSDDGSRDLRASDACVLPYDAGVCTHNSSFAAALAHGLPVVTTRGEAPGFPLLDGQHVLLCPPRDPDALAGAIEALLEGPAQGQRLRAAALRLYEEHFAWEKVVPQVIATLQ